MGLPTFAISTVADRKLLSTSKRDLGCEISGAGRKPKRGIVVRAQLGRVVRTIGRAGLRRPLVCKVCRHPNGPCCIAESWEWVNISHCRSNGAVCSNPISCRMSFGGRGATKCNPRRFCQKLNGTSVGIASQVCSFAHQVALSCTVAQRTPHCL